jgi:hypothetical protein
VPCEVVEMKKIGDFYFVFLMFFMIFCAGCCYNGKPKTFSTKEQFISHLEDSVVGLPIYDDNGTFRYLHCTGFFIDEKHIMTARHCLLPMQEIMALKKLMGDNPVFNEVLEEMTQQEIKKIKEIPVLKHNKELERDIYKNIKTAQPIKTKLVFMNTRTMGIEYDTNDVAILEVLDKKDYSKHWLKFAKYVPNVQEPIMLISMINSNPWYVTTGTVSKVLWQYSKDLKTSMPLSIVSNITVVPGASGGALLDTNGDIVGLTSSVDLFHTGQMIELANFVPTFHLKLFYDAIK